MDKYENLCFEFYTQVVEPIVKFVMDEPVNEPLQESSVEQLKFDFG